MRIENNQITEFINFYGLSDEEINEIIEQRNRQDMQKSSTGWFGGFGTSAFSKMGAFFSSTPTHKLTRRSNSENRDDEEKEVEDDRSENVPTKGESNSDFALPETSDKGSIDQSREYDKKIFEVVEIVEQEYDEATYNINDSSTHNSLRKSNQKRLFQSDSLKQAENYNTADKLNPIEEDKEEDSKSNLSSLGTTQDNTGINSRFIMSSEKNENEMNNYTNQENH